MLESIPTMWHFLISREPIPASARPVQCQYTWRDGCHEAATWRVACGPYARFYCVAHEGPPCGGIFYGDFVITAETTREAVVSVLNCGLHRSYSPSGRYLNELRCCACSEWIGDIGDPEIKHVSIPLDADCRPTKRCGSQKERCRACEETMVATPSPVPPDLNCALGATPQVDSAMAAPSKIGGPSDAVNRDGV